jgi:iron complex transport system ATP-binding protein
MHPIVELRNVTAWRGDTRVFDGLSLELPRGRHTAILGPNGAGKSTLLRLISREVHPEAREGSSMRLFGEERWSVWELRDRLGIVSQELQGSFRPRLTAFEVVLSGFRSSLGVWDHQRFLEEERGRAAALLEALGVAHLADRRYATLSTGEQRRVLLARALVHDPEVLVLDEPTSGLDPSACFRYLDLVRGLALAGKTLLLVTHHIHEIPPEVEWVVLLGGGRILADGPKSEVLTGPRLTDLFGTRMEVVGANGFFQVVPGRS